MPIKERFYDLKTLVWGVLGLLVLCALMKVSDGAGFIAIFIPLLVAFGKNRTELLVYIILATAVLTVTNAFIAPKGMVFSIAARALYLIVAGVIILQNTGRRSARFLTPLLSIFIYVGFQAMTSAQGWQPIISYLKILLFTVVFLAFWGMANAASVRDGVRPQALRSVVLVFACFLIFGSLSLIPFPGIAKLGAARALEMGLPIESVGLFQGVTFQPQALGPSVGAISVVLFADLLFSIRRWDKLYLLLLIGAPILIFYTSSRTAMGTWLAGMSFATFVFMCAHGVGARWKNRALGVLMLVGVLGGIVLFATPQMRDAVARFALKYTSEGQELDVSWETMTVTRQGLMDASMDNFRESPVIGNGFQVSKSMETRDIRSWGQLLSAPIEKGVWVTAVLEEGGVIGMILFVLFLIIAFWGMLSRRAYIGACALFVLLVSNFGEFTFFSMSSIGGVGWVMVFTGLALDAARLRQERQAYRWMPAPRVNGAAGRVPYPAYSAGPIRAEVSYER